MPKLPPLPADRRVDCSKIEEDLLHPVNGRGKAVIFQSWGFSLVQSQDLRGALLEHAASGQLTQAVVSPYGTRCIFRRGLRAPDGRSPRPMVCSVWQADQGQVGFRLITACPD